MTMSDLMQNRLLSIILVFLQSGNQWLTNFAASMQAKRVSCEPPLSDT